MPHYRLTNIKLPLQIGETEVIAHIHKVLSAQSLVSATNIKIVKKSLDARHKDNIQFIYSAEFDYDGKQPIPQDMECIPEEPLLNFSTFSKPRQNRPVIIGSGPAGMMAALCLAEAGAKPIVIERGAPVDERQKAVNDFWQHGKLSPVTNVQFGEGGAGTFSDGKLMTGIKKDRFTAKVLHEFAKAGAPQEILYLAKPHIGTDNLVKMTANLRRKIIALGGEYRFYEKLIAIKQQNNQLHAAVIERLDGTRYEITTDTLILALGHSARDTFKMLYKSGVTMEQKPFSVGVRIEHLQKDINIAQYGKKFANSPYLGAADYKLAVHLPDNRNLYTFCMCPGGVVVGATSLEGHVVTNGMSEFKRDKENANAALLINVDEKDFGSSSPLAGIDYQEELEKKAFELGGGNYAAPVQLVGDFLKNRATKELGKVRPSYKPTVKPSDFRLLFSERIIKTLKEGIREMDKKLKGFAADDAVMTAVESRSSSPVRIKRDEKYQTNIRGIYPIGEGAGYAGGITSAATDGVKCAAKILGASTPPRA